MSSAAVFAAAAQAVLQVVIIACAGGAMEAAGELGKVRRAALSTLAYRLLLPSLMFFNMCNSVSIDALRTLWVMPFFAALHMSIGVCLGACSSRFVSRPSDQFGRVHVSVATMIGNNGYIPLILLPAVINMNVLHGPGADIKYELAQAVAYISGYIAFGSIITFSVVPPVLHRLADSRRKQQEGRSAALVVSAVAPLDSARDDGIRNPRDGFEAELDSLRAGSEIGSGRKVEPAIVSLPSGNDATNSVGAEPPSALSLFDVRFQPSINKSTTEDSVVIGLPPVKEADHPSRKRKLQLWQAWIAHSAVPACMAWLPSAFRQTSTAAIESFFSGCNIYLSPPIVGSLCGLAVGLVPPLKALLFAARSSASVSGGSLVGGPGAAGVDSAWNYFLQSVAGVQGGNTTLIDVDGGLNGIVTSWSIVAVTQVGKSVTILNEGGSSAVLLCEASACSPLLHLVLQVGNSSATASGAAAVSLLPPAAPALAATLGAALQALGAAVTPVVTVMLGSTIFESLPRKSSSSVSPAAAPSTPSAAPVDDGGGVRWQVIATVCFIKLVVMPAVAIALVAAGVAAGLLPPGNSTLLFVLLVEAATPPAMNLQLLCEVMGTGAADMARVILVSYALAALTLTAWIAVFLALIRGSVLGSFAGGP